MARKSVVIQPINGNAKLYEDQGIDAQNLAGHIDRQMTEKYKQGHEIEWTYAEADLHIAIQKKHRSLSYIYPMIKFEQQQTAAID